MNYDMKYPVRLNLRLDQELHEQTAKAAYKLNISQAQFIRLALESQLNKSLKTIQDEFHSREL
jgi:predicted HicB family RNase H-like nuclease